MDYKEKLKAIINSNKTPIVDIDTFLKYFPELKESKDERIRKELLAVIDDLILPDEQKERFVAWLEKQDEKPNNVYDKELSEILGRVIRRYINDPNIPYIEREKVSMEIIPYVERLEKQGEQKSAKWDDEDERRLSWVIDYFNPSGELYSNLIYWFKSLKDRIQQSKQELSEEDEY